MSARNTAGSHGILNLDTENGTIAGGLQMKPKLKINLKNYQKDNGEWDEIEAHFYAAQIAEIARDCRAYKERKCPVGDLFDAILVIQNKCNRLEHEIKRMEEFPNER